MAYKPCWGKKSVRKARKPGTVGNPAFKRGKAVSPEAIKKSAAKRSRLFAERRRQWVELLRQSVQEIPKGEYSTKGLARLIFNAGIRGSYRSNETLINLLAQPEVKKILKGAGITIKKKAQNRPKKSKKQVKKEATSRILELNSKGWPGFKAESSLNGLAIQILEKKVTEYRSIPSLAKLLQGLLDADKIGFP